MAFALRRRPAPMHKFPDKFYPTFFFCNWILCTYVYETDFTLGPIKNIVFKSTDFKGPKMPSIGASWTWNM